LVHNLETRGQGRLPDGTILAATSVQRLFCDAGLHRVFTTGRSSILDYGTTTRTVPANLYNALIIRDQHCRFPGCDRPPEWTEAHHVTKQHARGSATGGSEARGRMHLGLGTRGRRARDRRWATGTRHGL
jgi:hypothetical protein